MTILPLDTSTSMVCACIPFFTRTAPLAVKTSQKMAAIQAVPPLSFSNYSSSSKPQLCIKFKLFLSTPLKSKDFPFNPPRPQLAHKNSFKPHSTVQEVAVETETEKAQTRTAPSNVKKKLYVSNLPWSFSVSDIKNLFEQCGAVTDVEIIKQKDGRSRGFVFVTMASGEEAQAAVDKLDSFEVSGRIIRVEFARRFKKPSPPAPPSAPSRETQHKLYVSNLAWKVRSTHLREFFSANFNPVSCRVVFDSPTGRSGGYGFVSFATREEAEAVISALNGKELMGRPVLLKFSVRTADESGSEEQENQPEE